MKLWVAPESSSAVVSSLLTATGSSNRCTYFAALFPLETLIEIWPFNSKQRGNGNYAFAAPMLSFPALVVVAVQLQVQLQLLHAAAPTAVLHLPATLRQTPWHLTCHA